VFVGQGRVVLVLELVLEKRKKPALGNSAGA
jgi:hypothetical protein